MICFSSFVVLIIEMELETFKITVLPLRQKMLNFSRRLVEDAADAEDVVQEAFIKLWYIREKLDAYHSVEALAMQVTKNLSLDKIKLRKPQGSELESVTLISEVVEKIHCMIMRNEKKRYQFPPVLRLSSCTFGHERLMPLTNKYGD